jgi:hypothetical protein
MQEFNLCKPTSYSNLCANHENIFIRLSVATLRRVRLSLMVRPANEKTRSEDVSVAGITHSNTFKINCEIGHGLDCKTYLDFLNFILKEASIILDESDKRMCPLLFG